MAKQLLFEDRARLKLQRGIKTLADAVAITMGPTGRNVIIDKSFGNPVVTKDGVTVSKEVELDDPYEHMGAKLVNEVATKTSDLAGDGTTTATVLAEALFRIGLKQVAAGVDANALVRGMHRGVEAVVGKAAASRAHLLLEPNKDRMELTFAIEEEMKKQKVPMPNAQKATEWALAETLPDGWRGRKVNKKGWAFKVTIPTAEGALKKHAWNTKK